MYCNDLSGNGAKLFGGRWNSEGRPALYTASSRALALLETIAHAPAKMFQSKAYILITIFAPDTDFHSIDVNDLPEGWDAPDIHPFTQKNGDSFLIENKKLILSAPSVLMPEENIYVLNPGYAGMKKVKIIRKRQIHFDRRIEKNFG